MLLARRATHSPGVKPRPRLLASAPLLLVGCASSQYPALDEPLPLPLPDRAAVAAAKPAGSGTASAAAVVVPTSLSRADVERVVDAGLGRFLNQVALEPRLIAGKFAGWRIVALEPPQLFQGVDLQPGDVVTRVNGLAIERETDAYDAFQAVRQAPALEVSYVRQEQARTLRLPIVGAPSPSLPNAAAAQVGSTPKSD